MLKKIIILFFCTCCVYAIPNIAILGTGGEIAQINSRGIDEGDKHATKYLIEHNPNIHKIANIKYQQVFNKDSSDLTIADWIKLAQIVQVTVNKSDVTGVVITHGTDSIEETAYFLNLLVKTDKPIVLVGAMRPIKSLSSDGALNLFDAVAVAANKKSASRDVMVVMNEHIYSARYVKRVNTTDIDAFKSVDAGALGSVILGVVNFNTNTLKVNKDNTVFHIKQLKNMKEKPVVEILYEHVGVSQEWLDKILEMKNLDGLVIAGLGDGNIPSYETDFLQEARKKGIIIVRSSIVGSGEVTANYNHLDSKFDLITANDFSPQKARILLMLSLGVTHNIKVIQQFFNMY